MALPHFRAVGGGSIINAAIGGGKAPGPNQLPTSLTRAAGLNLTKSLSNAYAAENVRVNAICPGLVKTDFAKALWEDGRGDKVAEAYPLNRLGEVEDIAAAALYLAADSGSWMTGQIMVLDGGGLVSFGGVG